MIRKYFFFILLSISFTIPQKTSAQESSIITLFKPTENITTRDQEIIEGKVSESFITRLHLTVTPFLPKKDEKLKSYTVNVRAGHFYKQVKLFPGLNIIRLETSGGKHTIHKAIFLIHEEKPKGIFSEINKWGSQSPIVFTSPQQLKINEVSPIIKGVVTDPSLKKLEIVVVNIFDFSSPDKQLPVIEKGKIIYDIIKIKNLQFSFKTRVRPGLNMIMAKPAGSHPNLALMQIKTLIYDKTSNKIFIEDPQLKEKIVYVKGTIKENQIPTITADVIALGKDKNTNIHTVIIFQGKANVDKDGHFSFQFQMKDNVKGFSINSPPTIFIQGGKTSISHTLTNWTQPSK